ncbi:MAG: N-acetylglucosamine-6-phosphate deacetylase [Phototrophicales bacterium]|nr:MAG: N-acetylglucosamine-6-phosphate deacetylase [Phototrophicales bacterium]
MRMIQKLFINARIITPTRVIEKGWLFHDARIRGCSSGDPPDFDNADVIDARGLTLLPGFIDVHVHGGAGHEAMDATPEALAGMAAFYGQHGVTGFLATTWTDSRERILAALRAIQTAYEHRQQHPFHRSGARLLGAHVEGPYLNPARCGAQSSVHIRRADHEEALEFLESASIRLMALAPEYEENHWLIRECLKSGITVSAAHTASTYEQMQRAVELGVTQVTHTFNAMTGLHHRDPGTVGAALTMPELRCEVIADNIHVHPAVMKLIWLAKGANGVLLITDAIRGAGMPDGDYPIDDRMIAIRDGVVRLPDGTLAGSTLTFDRAVANFMAATGEPLERIWQTTSLNAARAIGETGLGSLEVGNFADLVLVDEHINVHMTIVNGEIVFQKEGFHD